MKKFLVVLCLMGTILLSSCAQNEESIIDDLDGNYYYVECIYLSPFSSSTLDAYPGLYGSLIYITFSDNQIVYYGNDDETRSYNQIEFREEEVNKDLDDLITLDLNGVFETFESRYDIYSDDVSIGLTVFVDGDTLYLAETRMIGGSNDIFTVWSIVEIGK
ncbi:MAG: hypothetical protein JEZ05_04855 [Tenericutes bacterium]|nr:hypothetical protein [Mycoplasmatota bacterium]